MDMYSCSTFHFCDLFHYLLLHCKWDFPQFSPWKNHFVLKEVGLLSVWTDPSKLFPPPPNRCLHVCATNWKGQVVKLINLSCSSKQAGLLSNYSCTSNNSRLYKPSSRDMRWNQCANTWMTCGHCLNNPLTLSHLFERCYELNIKLCLSATRIIWHLYLSNSC